MCCEKNGERGREIQHHIDIVFKIFEVGITVRVLHLDTVENRGRPSYGVSDLIAHSYLTTPGHTLQAVLGDMLVPTALYTGT